MIYVKVLKVPKPKPFLLVSVPGFFPFFFLAFLSSHKHFWNTTLGLMPFRHWQNWTPFRSHKNKEKLQAVDYEGLPYSREAFDTTRSPALHSILSLTHFQYEFLFSALTQLNAQLLPTLNPWSLWALSRFLGYWFTIIPLYHCFSLPISWLLTLYRVWRVLLPPLSLIPSAMPIW